ncbi:hypothetical protein ACFE04_029084 [Oxalis oulophora]
MANSGGKTSQIYCCEGRTPKSTPMCGKTVFEVEACSLTYGQGDFCVTSSVFSNFNTTPPPVSLYSPVFTKFQSRKENVAEEKVKGEESERNKHNLWTSRGGLRGVHSVARRWSREKSGRTRTIQFHKYGFSGQFEKGKKFGVSVGLMITREKMVAQFTFLVWKEFLRWLRAAILLRTDCPHCQRCLFVVDNMVIRSWRFKNGGLERECYTSENVYSRSVLYGAP